MTNNDINVLVVGDSGAARSLLVQLLESDPQIHVIGAVNDGPAAIDFINNQRPDVIVMDIHRPNLDGLEATRCIVETHPVPIVICTTTVGANSVVSPFQLMEAGAVACVEKPVSREHADFAQLMMNLLETVKLMSEVKVVRRWPRSRNGSSPASRLVEGGKSAPSRITLIGIGASTGGPPVLQTILSSLPKDYPAAILIVQHIARGFLPGLVEWLNQTTALEVHVAAHGTWPLRGHVYLAPDDFHMIVDSGGRILLTSDDAESGVRPSVSRLFRSLAEVCGRHALGVLLSGMGKDGAQELKLMKDTGAITIAQDKETSVVHGMPGEAIELGGVTHVLAADNIADILITLVNRGHTIGGIAK